MDYVIGLQCHLCKAMFPAQALWVCDKCLGPLEVVYDYDKVRHDMSRAKIESRAKNLWRYRELLPIDGEPRTGLYSGYTPLVKADRLAKKLGVRELYLKDDSVNHPTFSYKDRVVSVAATRAVELGFNVFGCASTGNLANSVSAHAARLGLQVLRVHSARSRSQQDSRLERLQPAGRRHQGQLRRREPAVHADCGEIRLGIREHQPAQLLRRRRQDLRLRNRRAAWAGNSRGTSSRRSRAARCCRASRAHSAS